MSGGNLQERVRAWAFWPMLWKEFVQLRRDRLTFAMLTVLPAVQLALFGYAIRTEVRNLPAIVLDESRSQESRALVAAMENTGNFMIVGHVPDRTELRQAIGTGAASAAIVIPPTFVRDLKRRRTAHVQVIVDAADPLASSAAIAGASLVGSVRSSELSGSGIRTTPLEVRVRPWYNPGLRSAVYIVPGIVGVVLSLTMILIMSMAIVRERERGTLEQLIVTPIDKTSLMLGKIVPFLLIGYIQLTVVLAFGKLLFGVPVRGSLSLLYLLTLAFIVANLGIGLLISTVARNQVQAMQLGFFSMLPNILLSGFMFPRQAMPEFAQWIGAALPLTYYLQVIRGVLLKGVGWESLWRDALILAALALVTVAVSVRKFQKTVE
ncbi:MAG: ABC transporter permease [Gemmatimonadaceae bacterium]